MCELQADCREPASGLRSGSRPEEDKQQISVDQICSACERLGSKTSYRQGYKVAIVSPAHQMTVNAANSLPKTLEEPTPQSLLDSADLAAVRCCRRRCTSRCQQIAI